MEVQTLINSIIDKYDEHLEMQGKDAPLLLIQILGSLLYKERQEKEYYKKVANANIRNGSK